MLEGLLASQFHQDETPIEPTLDSPFYDFSLQQCLNEKPAGCDISTIDANYQDPLPECCWGTAEDWIFVSFGGMFKWANVGWNIIYCFGIIIVAKALSFLALKKLDYLSK